MLNLMCPYYKRGSNRGIKTTNSKLSCFKLKCYISFLC